MSGFAQGLVGPAPARWCSLWAWLSVGMTREVRIVVPQRMAVELQGLISDRAACLDWVSKNFEHPNVGQFGIMCADGQK